MIVTSVTLPWSTWDSNSEKLISRSLALLLPALTTCHNRTPDRIITSQNTIVLTVEFTEKLLCNRGDTNLLLEFRCHTSEADTKFPYLAIVPPLQRRMAEKTWPRLAGTGRKLSCRRVGEPDHPPWS